MTVEGSISWGDVTSVIIPVGTVAIGAVLWIVKLVSDVRGDLSSFKETVAKEYVSQTTLEKFETRLLAAIDRLGDRLDRFSHHHTE